LADRWNKPHLLEILRAIPLIRSFRFIEACLPKFKNAGITEILLPYGDAEIEIRLNLVSMPQARQAAIWKAAGPASRWTHW
jgi:hypothetical protein